MSKTKPFRSYSYTVDWYFLSNELLEMLQHVRRCNGVQKWNQAVSSALARVRRPDSSQYVIIKSKQRACSS